MHPKKLLEEKIINIIIYGIKSVGNQTKRRLQVTKKSSLEEHSQVNQIVQSDIYVGNCFSRVEILKITLKRSDELEVLVNCDPASNLSIDDYSINVAKIKWFPKEDLLALESEEKNLSSSRTLHHSN